MNKEWASEDLEVIRRLVREAVLPPFHGAVADTLLELGGGFTDRRRAEVGGAIMMTLVEQLCLAWAPLIGRMPPDLAYQVTASRVAQALPYWLGLVDTAEEGEQETPAKAAAADVIQHAKTVGEELRPHVASLTSVVDAIVDGCAVPPAVTKEAVAAALLSALAAHLNARFHIADDPKRLHRWALSTLNAFGVQVEMMGITAG